MHTRDRVFLSMTQDNRWQARFTRQHGWPIFKRWGTLELLQDHVTALGGWLRRDGEERARYRGEYSTLSEYYWTLNYKDDRDLEIFLIVLSIWLSASGDKFDKLHYVEGALKGIENWKKRNGKDYPDANDIASAAPWY